MLMFIPSYGIPFLTIFLMMIIKKTFWMNNGLRETHNVKTLIELAFTKPWLTLIWLCVFYHNVVRYTMSRFIVAMT